MKETEVTVQVFDTFEKTDEILRSQGFRLKDSYVIFDRYFSKHANVAALSYAELIGGSFLVRTVETGKPSHKLIYKKKVLDENGTVVSEEKVKTDLGDEEKIRRLTAVLTSLGLKLGSDFSCKKVYMMLHK